LYIAGGRGHVQGQEYRRKRNEFPCSSYVFHALLPDLYADDFARHDELDTPVFLTSGAGVVLGNGHGFAEATGCDAVAVQSLRDEVSANGRCATF